MPYLSRFKMQSLWVAGLTGALLVGMAGTAGAQTAAAPPPPPPPPKAEEVFPPLSISAWGRIATVLQNQGDPSKLDDVSQSAEVDIIMGGRIHKYISYAANLVGTYGPTGPASGDATGNIAILDLIAE